MSRSEFHRRTSWFAVVLLCALVSVPAPALAHVKWFSKVVDCISTPLRPEATLFSPLFMTLLSAALVTMVGVFYVETRMLGYFVKINQAASGLKRQISLYAARLLRLGVAIYFVAMALPAEQHRFILTPELITVERWVPAVQWLIALTVLWKKTMPIATLGIITLYAYAVWMVGWFHMLDYPYFIGVALFLLLDAVYGLPRHFLGLTLLRLTTGFSFLWVAVEKWLYPTWTYDLLNHELRQVTMGLDNTFFVMSAGFVEFTLAFLLIFGRLSSQIASMVLLVLLLAAIPLVGMKDAIGHAPLIVVLLIFSVTQNRIGYPVQSIERWGETRHILSYAISVPGLIGLYYLGHMLGYPFNSDVTSTSALFSAVLVIPLCWRVISSLPKVFPVRKQSWREGGSAMSFAPKG